MMKPGRGLELHQVSECSTQPSRRTNYLVFNSGLDESKKQRVEEDKDSAVTPALQHKMITVKKSC